LFQHLDTISLHGLSQLPIKRSDRVSGSAKGSNAIRIIVLMG
jgi:hypothetical protein